MAKQSAPILLGAPDGMLMAGWDDTTGFDLAIGLDLAGCDPALLFVLCRAFGATVSVEQLALASMAPEALSDEDHDVLVQVLNERFMSDGLGCPVAYRRPLPDVARERD